MTSHPIKTFYFWEQDESRLLLNPMALLLECLLAFSAPAEVVLPLSPGGFIALATRGPSAFRLRFLPPSLPPPLTTPMVSPSQADAPFYEHGDGISSSFGSVRLSPSARLELRDSYGSLLTSTDPLLLSHAAGEVGGEEGRNGLLTRVRFSSSPSAKLYGRGAGMDDATQLTSKAGAALVDNTRSYAPHYYSTDGYSCLGLTDVTSGENRTNELAVAYALKDRRLSWSHARGAAFELYLMPAASLDEATAAYYSLIGSPAVPPRWAFGFLASRWGWKDRGYIERVLHSFRDSAYPIDAFLVDFEWFTNTSDYTSTPLGLANYHDFGYNPLTFPDPAAQLSEYASALHVRMGGIRKPRLANPALLAEARGLGLLLPGCERSLLRSPRSGRADHNVNDNKHIYEVDAASQRAPGPSAERVDNYACGRNLDFSKPATRSWYSARQVNAFLLYLLESRILMYSGLFASY